MKKKILSLLIMLLVTVTAVAETTFSQVLYEKAILGDAEAMYQLSLCYMNGLGVTADYDKSDYWLERAAYEGQPNAIAAIRAIEGKIGLTDAKRRELAAEEKNERKRIENKGKKDDVEYSDVLLKKAQNGDAEAQNQMGRCYYWGNGVEKDYSKAVYWFRRSAELGYAAAQNNLGACYHNGHGVPQDYTQAVSWYRKAAEQGYAAAQNNLGTHYEFGNGVPQNYTQAVYWYRKAAEQGYAIAQCHLGFCYDEGNGVDMDFRQAAFWFRKAAEQGYADAQCSLGSYYYEGYFEDLDESEAYVQALYWWRKAAEQNHDGAQYNLGFYYFQEESREAEKQAAYWFSKAAEQDVPMAQFYLGICYESGYGVTKDVNKAVELFRKAARQGIEEAQGSLMKMGLKW